MNVTGIIAEYNPFHNGHLYQLNKIKEQGADYVIIVMSGDFTQRGIPALSDKYMRTKIALACGADLVLELPSLFSASSAFYFARAGVALLDKIGVTDTLSFGCETEDTRLLNETSSFLLTESPVYQQELQKHLRTGNSFPKSRALSIQKILGDNVSSLLSSPNNILALEYCMALMERKSNIVPSPIKRNGDSFHESELHAHVNPSATAIRTSFSGSTFPDLIRPFIPSAAFDEMLASYNQTYPIQLNDFSSLLHYQLLLDEKKGFSGYCDLTDNLSDRIIKHISHYQSFSQFCDLLKSKDMTYTRINRCLLHILLHQTSDMLQQSVENDYISYARVLGFKESSLPLLHSIKKNTDIPILTKPSAARTLLSEHALTSFEQDILTSHIYQSVVCSKFSVPFNNEYQRQIVLL